jgi:hypothetical protein
MSGVVAIVYGIIVAVGVLKKPTGNGTLLFVFVFVQKIN